MGAFERRMDRFRPNLADLVEEKESPMKPLPAIGGWGLARFSQASARFCTKKSNLNHPTRGRDIHCSRVRRREDGESSRLSDVCSCSCVSVCRYSGCCFFFLLRDACSVYM